MGFLTELSLRNRAVTFLAVILITLGSIYATISLKMELIPDIEMPVISVVSIYPGAPPEEVEREITAPVEAVVSGTEGLKNIYSTSAEHISFVLAEFKFGTNMDKVELSVSRNIALLNLPPNVKPQVLPLGMEMMPVVVLSLSGDVDPAELQEIADSKVVPRITALDGVFSVDLEGGSQREVLVRPDTGKIDQLGLSLSWIAYMLQSGNISIPTGKITLEHTVYPLHALHRYTSLEEIENTIVTLSNPATGAPLLLKDVAEVSLSPTPQTAITRTNGKDSVGIIVLKDGGANTVSVANAIIDEMARIEPTLGSGVELHTILDQSEFIERSIRDLTQEALLGAILAIIIIFLFLWAVRASLVTIVSIPLSVLIGFMLLNFCGLTINILTLAAMAIAIGRVVDDSIVVLENTYRHLQQGEGFKEAALSGAKEVAAPITSATLATVAIFLPMAFVGGIAGEMFWPFALTITFALLASLLVALMVIPPLSSFISIKKLNLQGVESWYHRIYTRALRWSLRRRALTLIIALVLFFGSFGLMPFIGTSFLPATGEKMVFITIEMPQGTDLATTAAKTAEVERILGANPQVESYHTTAGSSGTMAGSFTGLMGGGASGTAAMIVHFNGEADLEKEVAKLRSACRQVAGEESAVSVLSGQEAAAMMGNTLEITVTGRDATQVAQVAEEIVAALKSKDMEGELTDLRADVAQTKPEINIQVDPASAVMYGLTPASVAMGLRHMMVGQTVAKVSLEGETFDVFLAGMADEIGSIEELTEVKVGLSPPVRLGDIATVERGMGLTQVRRVGQKPAATVWANITAADVGMVNREVQQVIDELKPSFPPEVEVKIGGVMEQMMEGFSSMYIAIGMAIGIAYLVLAISLGSLLNSLIVMVSLPLASIGALLGLFITNHTLGISGLMGILMLVGIVLTNAIVLITFVEQLRQGGTGAHDALIEGGRIRLRPILMTALTTIIALVPLSLGLGEGTLMAAELAVVVIGGLFSSTLLTLLVIPVIYSLCEGWRHRLSA